ncbi:hypothetical protein BU14_0188s0036 [Porphyra umbilicalis]|uniref:ATP-dependent DNA helicase n=1 Tax=Porphyra umbilicalis TaxID=2786 RepID=A0A1X6P6P7_PORUM|nr:hypothetical protein BU14_0188s0036 [Porphyra umbilicalis]|eukprot:OSX76518.1 hypothetical protein BU14_0188s0036 [Porphyra umbilicalis]
MASNDDNPPALLALDPSQSRACALVLSGCNVALFGRAGSGKSEVMRRMISEAQARWGAEHVAVGSLSGSAALVIGGQTLHSLFGMDTRPLSREAWLREALRSPHVVWRLNSLRVLFIDEVCTISSSLFMKLAYVMRRVAPPHLQHLPFAGCQIVAGGDPLQIAPVKVTDTSPDRMVFDCSAWRATFEGAAGKVVCLTGFHRQSHDAVFQSVLDRVRWGRAGHQTIKLINDTSSNTFTGPVTQLRIRKLDVLAINEARMEAIQSPPHTFQANDVFLTSDPKEKEDAVAALRSCVDLSLSVKRKAFVILTRKMHGVPPGTRGVVTDVIRRTILTGADVEEVDTIMCNFDGRQVEVIHARFSAYNSAGHEVAFCNQMPLILGWAVTIHRAQGLTLDALEINFELDNRTTCGLVYTALSRVRSFSSLRVCGLRRDLIRVSRCATAYYERNLLGNGIDPHEDGRPPLEATTSQYSAFSL